MSNGSSRVLELVVGLFVCLGVAAAFFLTFWVSGVNTSAGASYNVTANFTDIGGVKVGTKVSASGVTVGRVTKVELLNRDVNFKLIDENNQMLNGKKGGKVLFVSKYARVTINIEGRYKFPIDVEASILTAGLLGEKFIGLDGGGTEDDVLEEGSQIKETHPALVLEKLVQRLVADKAGGEDEKK